MRLSCLLLLTVSSVQRGSTASTTEERKEAYRQAVIDNYDETTSLTRCPCTDGGTARQRVADDPVDGYAYDEFGRNFVATDTIDGFNPGITVFPYSNLPIPREDEALDNLFCRVFCEEQTTGDFSLTLLMRTMGHGNNTLQNKIVTRLQASYDSGELRLWQAPGEDHNIYYTENHMLMWLSATFLLKDRLTYPVGDANFMNVDRRLEHLLRTILRYGFYEWPFTLAGLLNLADFAPSGSTIQDLASQAVTRLMSDWLLFLNDAGHFYPVAPRNKNHKYLPSFHVNTWVLRGTGLPFTSDQWKRHTMAQVVAVTSFNFDALEASWEAVIDRVIDIGHAPEEFKTVHKDLPREERVLYQWAAGHVLQPAVVSDSIFGLRLYELIGSNPLFEALYFVLGFVPDFLAQFFATLFRGQTEGSGFAGARVHVYKHHGVVLSSLEDYVPGTRGFQQYPWVATVHDLPVMTQAGLTGPRLDEPSISNTHMPNIVQDGNVALISYKPRWDVRMPFRFFGSFLGYDLQIVLLFPTDRFDELAERGNWILGRRQTSYVGVWRYNGWEDFDCSVAIAAGERCIPHSFHPGRSQDKASVWAIVVGNDQTHGTFDNFISVVEQGTVQEDSPSLIESLIFWQGNYRTGLSVDGKTLFSDM